jgi:uncharacterized protein YjbJ (UPF0337 family)
MKMNKITKLSSALILTLISTNALLATQPVSDSPKQKAENTDKNASILPPVNKDIIEGKWEELKGKIKVKWGKITDDDLLQAKGTLQQLAGIIQVKYGLEKDRAEKEVKKFLELNNIDINEYKIEIEKEKEKPKS